MVKPQNDHAVRYKQRMIEAFGGCCMMVDENGDLCCSTEKLEFAHLEKTDVGGWGRGRNRRIWDVSRNRVHFILWCKTCHESADKYYSDEFY